MVEKRAASSGEEGEFADVVTIVTSGTDGKATHAHTAADCHNVALTVSDGSLSSDAATVANIYSGATPTVFRFRVPGPIGVRAGQTTGRDLSQF